MDFHLEITEQIVRPFLSLKDGAEKLKNYISSLFRQKHPEPNKPEQEADTRNAYGQAKTHLKVAQKKLDATPRHIIRREADKEHAPSPFDIAIGCILIVVGLGFLAVVPAISAMLITDSGDISLVADEPLWGFAFGLAALGGVLSVTLYRDTLDSEPKKVAHDRNMIRLAGIAAFAWVSVAALGAYPIGGEMAAHEWTIDAAATAHKAPFTVPQAVLFPLSLILEIAAASALKNAAAIRLFPRPITIAIANPAYEAQADVVETLQNELAKLAAALDEFPREKAAWLAAEHVAVDTAIALFETLQAKAQAASAHAHAQALLHLGKGTSPMPTQDTQPDDLS